MMSKAPTFWGRLMVDETFLFVALVYVTRVLGEL